MKFNVTEVISTTSNNSRCKAPYGGNMKKTLVCLLVLVLFGFSSFGFADSVKNIKKGFFFGQDLRNNDSVVYVLDLSGSMTASTGSVASKTGISVAGEAAGQVVGSMFGSFAGRKAEDKIKKLKQKVEKVKMHLIASLQGLPPHAKYNIILFDNKVEKLSPTMLQATEGNINKSSLFVYRLEASGSTNMYEGLKAAIATGTNHIILLTDGLPTSSSPEAIINMVKSANSSHKFTVSTVGVGAEEAKSFLSQLASDNGGTFTFYK